MNWSALDYYQEIEKASLRMLEAARTGDWDQVSELEAVCEGLINLVQRFDSERELDAPERAEKSRILHRILRMDAEVRSLLDPHLSEFGHSLDPSGHTLH